MHGRVRVFIAASLDGFIAGVDDDLSWLPGTPDGGDGPDASASGYEAFMADVGALLMGRTTYDVVSGFDGPWPYGDRPVLVATRRELVDAPPSVRPVAGDALALVDAARRAAGGRDVYVDGGEVIRQVLDAGLLDEAIVTVVPVVLGRGKPLFAGARRRHGLTLVEHRPLGQGLVQLTYRLAAG